MLIFYLNLLQNSEDEQSFEEFYNKFYNIIFYIAKDHLKNKESAEDCAHEVLIFFAKNFHNITHDFNDKKLMNYIRVVSKCIAIDMYRREKKHLNNVVDTDVEDFFDLSTDEFDIYDEMDLKEAFEKMPEEYRYICYLKYVYQLSGEEIGKMLHISQPLVRKRCMLGRQFIKDFLTSDE